MSSETFQSGVKFAAYPSKTVAGVLSSWIGAQRCVYNCKVSDDRGELPFWFREHPEDLGLRSNPGPTSGEYSHHKHSERTPWLYTVPSQVLRNGAMNFVTAKKRHLKGLAKAPVKKRRNGKQTLTLTQELFEFVPIETPEAPELASTKEGSTDSRPNAKVVHREYVRQGGYRLRLGTTKFPVGELPFVAHRPFKLPTFIVITRDQDRWWVSFSYQAPWAEFQTLTGRQAPEGGILRSREELAYELNGLNDQELENVTWGGDRGIVVPLYGSDPIEVVDRSTGEIRAQDTFGLSPVQERRCAQKEQNIKARNRHISKQQKGSRRRQKLLNANAKDRSYITNARKDNAHQVSRQLVNSPFLVLVFEALRVTNMVRRAQARPDPDRPGKYLRNGRKAKAGLNRGLHHAAPGMLLQYVKYKAAQSNKLVIEVPAAYSSQECSQCEHIHPGNRPSQALFACLRCHHEDHADHNASLVIKKRGLSALRSGQVKNRAVKRTGSKVPNPRKGQASSGTSSGSVSKTGQERPRPSSRGVRPKEKAPMLGLSPQASPLKRGSSLR